MLLGGRKGVRALHCVTGENIANKILIFILGFSSTTGQNISNKLN